jgi:DNA-binding MarR family transcriptional regulator
MKKRTRGGKLNLTWDEIGLLCEGMSLASRPMGFAVKDITEEYSLAPRGAWITAIIAAGRIHPLDLADLFRVGRSLITAELTRLADAGLIQFEQHAQDGRRTELKLTALGNTVMRRVRDELSKLILQRLAAYTREEVLLCSRMLRDFRVPQSGDGESTEPATERRRLKAKRVATPAPKRRRRSRQSA